MTVLETDLLDMRGRENIQGVIDTLKSLGNQVGEWSHKVEAREQGVSIHIRFDNKTDVWTTARWADILQQCPGKLINACERLLKADELLRECMK